MAAAAPPGVMHCRCFVRCTHRLLRSIASEHSEGSRYACSSFETGMMQAMECVCTQVRPGHDKVHLLRLLPRGVPGGRHRGGPQL